MKKVNFLIWTVLAVFAAGVSYGSFCLYRWVNWEFAYKKNVQQEIYRMVKSGCLEEEDDGQPTTEMEEEMEEDTRLG